jgi:hypothetical protein
MRPDDSAATVKPQRIGAARAERLVALYQHDLRPDALELDEAAAAAAGAAIEADVVGTEARRQTGREQELGIEPRDLQEHRSGPLIPVHREVAVEFLHPRRAVIDRLDGGRALLRRGLPAFDHAQARTRQQQRTNE